MEEQWKDVQGYERLYQVSNMGRVKSLERVTSQKHHVSEHLVSFHIQRNGYLLVDLWKNGKREHFLVHRLVASNYIPVTGCKKEVNHIDGNKANNRVDNLEWVTGKENIRHAVRTGLLVGHKGENNAGHKLDREKVKWIREHYIPFDKEFGQCAMARKFGVTHDVVGKVVHFQTWCE